MRNLIEIALCCSFLVGCSLVDHQKDIDWEGWVDWIKEGQPLLEELLEIFEEDDPPAPDPGPKGPLFYMPEWKLQASSGLSPGVAVMTSCYVPGHAITEPSGSIAISYVLFREQTSGVEFKYCWGQMSIESPAHQSTGGYGYNWRDYDGDSNCHHLYTTAYPENEAGVIDCPHADGTRRGKASIGFAQPGTWDVWVGYRATPNRTSRAWLSITLGDGVSHWYQWNQRGNGVGDEGYVEVPVGQGLTFAGETPS